MSPWMRDVRDGLGALRGTFGDVARHRDDPVWQHTLRTSLSRLPPALVHTVPWLLRARSGGDASFIKVVEDNAKKLGGGLALEMDEQQLTWRELSERTSRVAHVLTALGVKRGQVVALIGKNSPDYLATLLGVSRVGATASLINYHLEGQPLAHALSASQARVVLSEEEFLDAAKAASSEVRVLSFRGGELEERMQRVPGRAFPRVQVGSDTDFVYIFTSGTTGLPKPCRVTHARAVLAGGGVGPPPFGMAGRGKLHLVLPPFYPRPAAVGAGAVVLELIRVQTERAQL
ncbi:MAG TPA: AMP-binding protein, partial [Polyangiaceae bacterium]|nr:AMP-binding protein [Polyangiaceae bacterium]